MAPAEHGTTHDGVEDGLVNASNISMGNKRWLEQGLGTAEPLIGDGDPLTIGETVVHVQ